MRKALPLMITLLLAAPLAGCAGSDGDVNVNLTTEEIQGLIEHNMDDFLNNTTVTVVNHYHNNTTMVDSSTTSTAVENIHHNGSSAVELHVFTVDWQRPGSEIANTQLIRPWYMHRDEAGNYSDEPTYGIGLGPISNYADDVIYVKDFEGTTVEITAPTCVEAYAYSQWGYSSWSSWLLNNYGSDWNGTAFETAKEELYDYFRAMYHWKSVSDICGWGQSNKMKTQTLFEISLAVGDAIKIIQTDHFVQMLLSCDDGFSWQTSSTGNSANGTLYHDDAIILGGQANCTVYGQTSSSASWELRESIRYNQVPAPSFAVYYEIIPVNSQS